MASGDFLCAFFPYDNEPPSANYATLGLRNGHPVLNFDAGTDESAVFTGELPANYSGTGITITVKWMGASATSGNCVWVTAIERIDDEGLDTDADSFASGNTATAAAPGTTGMVQYTSIAHASGSEMDSLAAGETFRLKVTRNADDGSDTMAGDAQIISVRITQT